MADNLHVCLFDTTAGGSNPFSKPFNSLKGIKVIGVASTWMELREWLQHDDVDIVAVNLDSRGEDCLEVVEQTTRLSPTCGIIGVSNNTDPVTIIGAMRAGCTQFVPGPIDNEDLAKAIDRIRITRRRSLSRSKRICVIGSSGGVGATMISCNLAIELGHLTDRRCALVDMNLEFGDVCCAFDCAPRYTLGDLCRDGVDIDRHMVSQAMHELPCNVSIMGRPDNVEDSREMTPEGIQTSLQIMAEQFPYVIIDLPRTFSLLSAAAVNEADCVLIVTQLNVPSIRNATRIFKCLVHMGAREDRIEIVLNRVKANFERITPDEVAAQFGQPVFALIPNDYQRVQSSLDLGHPVMSDSPNSPARMAVQKLARRIAGEDIPDDINLSNPGLFSKLWKKPLKTG